MAAVPDTANDKRDISKHQDKPMVEKYDTMESSRPMHTQKSEDEFEVGYLGAYQQPCSKKYPTFDVGLQLPRDSVFITPEHIQQARRLPKHFRDHEGRVWAFGNMLRRRAREAGSQEQDSSPREHKALVIMWMLTVSDLASKAEEWEDELCMLQDEVLMWLQQFDNEETDVEA